MPFNLKKLYSRSRRFGWKPRIKSALKGKTIFPSVSDQLVNTLGYPTETLTDKRLLHVGPFSSTNAGDGVLTVVLRDLFSALIPGLAWNCLHVHDVVDDDALAMMQRTRGVVVGGGGLFLKDTNSNSISGWQWPVRIDQLRNLPVPLALFAVGYNRFRSQGDFDENFRANLIETVRAASFVGLRNHGSIQAIKSYLPEELHSKIVYQPCMTTIIGHLYPGQFETPRLPRQVVGLNCAFDRSKLRFGDREPEILRSIAAAARKLGETCAIRYYAHCGADEAFLPYLDQAGVKYDLVALYRQPARLTVEELSKSSIVIGMRGHAQMIPFGCGVPIVSLVSHDKMRWFLEDIGAPEWGIDVAEQNLEQHIVETASSLLSGEAGVREKIRGMRQKLWEITTANVARIAGFCFEGNR